MLDIGLKFYAVPSPYPYPLNDLDRHRIFLFSEMLYHISQSSESIHISNRVCWGGAGDQNIEHPHTLVSLLSVYFLSNAF